MALEQVNITDQIFTSGVTAQDHKVVDLIEEKGGPASGMVRCEGKRA